MTTVRQAQYRTNHAFRHAAALLVFVIGNLSGHAVVGAPLSLTVGDAAVQVTGLTPRADAVLFWFSKETRKGQTFADARALVLHDQGGGTASMSLAVPVRSVWVAVDTVTGAFAAGAPSPFPLNVSELPTTFYVKDAGGDIVSLEEAIPRMALLLVRPGNGNGVGAWLTRGRDGGPGDRDGSGNGKLQLAFEDTVSITDAKKKGPKHVQAGDVVVAIDPGHFDVLIGQVGK